MKVRPLHDRVLIKRIEEEKAVKGGIIIPDTAREKPMEGKVVAVGPGKMTDDGKRAPLDVKAGDRILFGKYAGTEIKVDEQDYVIMREEEILAVFETASKMAS
jgi:chaperonin GroES